MHCTLLIPDLFLPRETAETVTRGLHLPALTTLLARARAQRFAAITTEGWLCQAFEVERQHDWPIAPLTLELDGGDPGGAYWLRADPVHVEVERTRLALLDSALFDLTADEAQSLVQTLQDHFSRDGFHFHAPMPKRWYVRAAGARDLTTRGVREAAGQDMQRNLPEGADALSWHRVFNEAQMLLHEHPVNESREGRGELTVNSVWLWGGGTRPGVPGRPFDHVWSDDPVAAALGAAGDAHSARLPADAHEWLASAGASAVSSGLVVLDALRVPASYHDTDAWRHRLSALESSWFAPLSKAFRNRGLTGLALVVPAARDCWRFEIGRRDLLKFWRAPKPLSAYA
jgi:hypothetical protein